MQNLTVGEQFRILMKREGIKQVDLSQKMNIDKRNISQTIKMFDENRSSLKTIMDYAEALGNEVEIGFKKKEEKK